MLRTLTKACRSTTPRPRAYLPSLGSSHVRMMLPTTTISAAAVDVVNYHHHHHQQQLLLLYHSRAHPKPIPEYAITTALDSVLEDIARRRRKRERKWHKNQKARNNNNNNNPKTSSSSSSDADSSSPPQTDETIELALNFNLDPRKPGQALRGSLELPHGTGKTAGMCVVLTADEAVAQQALDQGAAHAGGADLVQQLAAGEIAIDSITTCLATKDVMPILSQTTLPRLLGPRGLYPNAKVGTLCDDSTTLLENLSTQLAGKQVSYRAEQQGIVHVPVGKASFGATKLLDNLQAILNALFEAKPESYGKGKKAGGKQKKGSSNKTAAKYLLKASLSSTQGKGLRLDVKTVDPSSAFFLTSGEEGSENSSSSTAAAAAAGDDESAAA